MTSYLRHAAKSDLKALYVVRDLSEKKSILLLRLLKFAWPEMRHNRQCLTSHV